MGLPNCTKCGLNSMEVVEDCGNGIEIVACLYCDLPQDPNPVYQNHCWNCGCDIDSITCKQSVSPGMGYYCPTCGKDLSEWKQNKTKQQPISDNNFKKLIDIVGEQVDQRKRIINAIMTNNLTDENFEKLLISEGAL